MGWNEGDQLLHLGEPQNHRLYEPSKITILGPQSGLNVLCAKLLQSRPTLCDPMDSSLPGFSVHRILQARILEWVVMPSPRGSSQPIMNPCLIMSFALAGKFFTTRATSTLATSCKELTHWKRLRCWEGLGAGGEGDDRG